jgi:hypothetical protein
MVLRPTLDYLLRIANEAVNAGNPWLFLNSLGPLHVRWHDTPIETRTLGFLIFHWLVIFYFRSLGLDRIMRITPYNTSDFSPGGRFYSIDVNWNSWMGSISRSRNINELIRYSAQIERWHNNVHMTLEMATGTPMMDAARNIYYSTFWNLHFFINNRFENEANSVRTTFLPWLNTVYQVIQYIDDRYPPQTIRTI